MTTVYTRTAKGNEEIKNRTYKLDHIHRFVLIMIDGKASTDSIVSRSSQQWNPNKCLSDLEHQGFIENTELKDLKNSNIGMLQQNLITCIIKHLPENNTKVVNKILNSPNTKKSLSDAIDSGCIFIKLTISEKASVQLKVELHKILDSSVEVK